MKITKTAAGIYTFECLGHHVELLLNKPQDMGHKGRPWWNIVIDGEPNNTANTQEEAIGKAVMMINADRFDAADAKKRRDESY